MDFTKKIWVNVPDTSNLPDIPKGQDALARFDAENMNRIEDGISGAATTIKQHGLDAKAQPYFDDFINIISKGSGFYTVGDATDTPSGITSWLNLIQLTKDYREGGGGEAGVQIVTDCLPAHDTVGETWIRTVFGGSPKPWNKLLHSGNYHNFANAKIQMGSYVGAGTYGSSNPNSLKFNFVPKVVILFTNTTTAYEDCGNITTILFGINEKAYFTDGTSNGICYLSYQDSTMNWYGKGTATQLNSSGKTYYYIAIG